MVLAPLAVGWIRANASHKAQTYIEENLTEKISFEDLAESYRVLVHSGAPIAAMNTVRKHLSAVKGGRMAVAP